MSETHAPSDRKELQLKPNDHRAMTPTIAVS
jgi:hypothetical protein